MNQMLKALCLSVTVGALFALVNVPLPWTLGPIAAISLYSLKTGERMYWPITIRNTALIVLGYAMGRPFTVETGYKILEHLPLMLIATLITVFVGILVGYITHRKTGISLETCLLGCVPGGLSQMVVLAEEMENTDQTAVTIMQTVRMLSVVFSVPFLTMHVLHDGDPIAAMANSHLPAASNQEILIYICVAIAGAFLARFLRLPTAFLLGPILFTGAFILGTGIPAPVVPSYMISIAQICVGTYIGSSINLAKIKRYHGLMPCLFVGVAGVLLVSLFTGYMVVALTSVSFVTAFLSTAPGGLAEMGITALIVGADISTMTAYQLVRLLFIMLLFPIIVKLIIKFQNRTLSPNH